MLKRILITGAASWALTHSFAVAAQEAASGVLEEIIVTANKRAESISDVPMSVIAVSGNTLMNLNLNSVADLGRVVSGLNVTTTAFGTQVYTLRGVGFYDSTLAAVPAVSVYVDEVPLPFAVMTIGAALDPERVEALMGPQGTLFGQNSTGGAINYVSAKPTKDFQAGVTATAGNYKTINGQGYLSGPLTGALGARFSFSTDNSDGWQRGISRGDRNGEINRQQARVLLDWKPTDAIGLLFNVNGFKDKSDVQAPRNIGYVLNIPSRAPFIPQLTAASPTGGSAENADWDPNKDFAKDNDFYQVSLRADFALPKNLTLTNIASYGDYNHEQPTDIDGLPFNTVSYLISGGVQSLYDELRLSGNIDKATVVVGASYQKSDVDQKQLGSLDAYTTSYALTPSGGPRFLSFEDRSKQKIDSEAIFANIDYDIAAAVTLHAGARYTTTTSKLEGCTGGDAALNLISGLVQAPGECVTKLPSGLPGVVQTTLDESNTSWRVGADYKPTTNVLFYTNISRGFKAGGYPVLSASRSVQLEPVHQEQLTAYEAGFKASVPSALLRTSGAIFYYDYKDKQIRGRLPVPPFGVLEKLINIPKSQVLGAELNVRWAPLQGLEITTGASYIQSKIKDFSNFDVRGAVIDLDGTSFPNAPDLRVNADVQYEHALGSMLHDFIGSDYSHVSSTYGTLGTTPEMKIPSYDLLGLRIGVRANNNSWRAWLWVRNVTDKFYVIGATRAGEALVNYAGMPRTIGVSAAVRL